MPSVAAKSLALRAAVFGVALAAGWSAKWTLLNGSRTNISPAATPPSAVTILPADPADLIDTRLALAEVLLAADAAGLKRLAEGMVGKGVDCWEWRALFRGWFQVAPGAAWQFADSHRERLEPKKERDPFASPERPSDDSIREAAIAIWSRLDPRAARAALAGPEDVNFGDLVAGAMECEVAYGFQLLGETKEEDWENHGDLSRHLARLARENPPLAREWADRLGTEDFAPALLVGWLHQDAAAAGKWLEQSGDVEYYLEQAVDLIGDDSGLYQPALLDLLVRLEPTGIARIAVLTQLFSALAEHDLPLALREIERAIPDPETRAASYLDIADHLHSKPELAWEVLSRIEPGATGDRWTKAPAPEVTGDDAVTRFPTRKSPTYGGFPFTSGESESILEEVKRRALRAMFRIDKDRAVACLAGCPAGQIAAIGDEMIPLWAATNPIEAATWLSRNAKSPATDFSIDEWFSNAHLTHEETRSLVGELAPGGFRDAFVSWAAEEILPEDPVAALEFVRANTRSPVAQAEAYQRWANADTAAALEALANDPDAPPEAWREVVRHAAAGHLAKVGDYVEEMAEGPARDAALWAMADNAPRTTLPADRTAWACEIADATMRREMMDATLTGLGLDLREASNPDTLGDIRESIQAASTMTEVEKQTWLRRIQTEFPLSP
jgi:hypothetical protein